MSSYYGLIVSEFRHYDHEKYNKRISLSSPIDIIDDDNLPPSYSAVLAEKYQQQQQQQCTTWDKKLNEMNDVLRSMKKSIHDAQLMMKSFQYCCQKLEFKNQYLLTKLEKEIVSISKINGDTTSFDMSSQSEQVYQKDANDSLTRMNQSLEKLIQEAEMSLNTRLSLHADPYLLRRSRSCPKFTTNLNHTLRRKSNCSMSVMEYDQNILERVRQLQLQQQKKRYFHSQWKLAIAMNQFVQTVQNTTNKIKKEEINNSNRKNIQVVHHHHHIHHHIHHVYHHYENNTASIQEEIQKVVIATPTTNEATKDLSISPLQNQQVEAIVKTPAPTMMITSNSSLTSLFKYALHTVGVIPQSPEVKDTVTTSPVPKSVKYRTMFLATVLVLQKFNKKPIWVNRGNLILTRWNQKSKQQCSSWIQKSQLLLFAIHLLALNKRHH